MTEKARGDTRLEIIRVEFIPRNLFTDELIVRLVAVERLDYVVAVTPDVRPKFISLEPVSVCVPGNVEPHAAPALTVVRRCKQAVDDYRKRLWRLISQKGLCLF